MNACDRCGRSLRLDGGALCNDCQLDDLDYENGKADWQVDYHWNGDPE